MGCEASFRIFSQRSKNMKRNSAERALRTGVQWRKISFGDRSADGELATARLLTIAET